MQCCGKAISLASGLKQVHSLGEELWLRSHRSQETNSSVLDVPRSHREPGAPGEAASGNWCNPAGVCGRGSSAGRTFPRQVVARVCSAPSLAVPSSSPSLPLKDSCSRSLSFPLGRGCGISL